MCDYNPTKVVGLWREKVFGRFGRLEVLGTSKKHTPPKFNIDPEQWWLEDYFPIGKVTFQGLC